MLYFRFTEDLAPSAKQNYMRPFFCPAGTRLVPSQAPERPVLGRIQHSPIEGCDAASGASVPMIRHPDPAYAVSYGILTVAFALRELILFDQARTFRHALAVGDDDLKTELPRMFLRYLGIETD